LQLIVLDPTESTVGSSFRRRTPLTHLAVIDATSFEDLLIEGSWVIRWASWTPPAFTDCLPPPVRQRGANGDSTAQPCRRSTAGSICWRRSKRGLSFCRHLVVSCLKRS